MMKKARQTGRLLISGGLVCAAVAGGSLMISVTHAADNRERSTGTMAAPMTCSEKEWRSRLTPEQYRILREKGTERAFTGRFHDHHEPGKYVCAGCGQPLFDADAKFDSGTGWPSYYQAIDDRAVSEKEDRSWGIKRTEVLCSRCGGHLGHVFQDGPRPTGLRYCINSAALEFDPEKQIHQQ
jgi:peptide-methionine (R)-S-oxide reductase